MANNSKILKKGEKINISKAFRERNKKIRDSASWRQLKNEMMEKQKFKTEKQKQFDKKCGMQSSQNQSHQANKKPPQNNAENTSNGHNTKPITNYDLTYEQNSYIKNVITFSAQKNSKNFARLVKLIKSKGIIGKHSLKQIIQKQGLEES